MSNQHTPGPWALETVKTACGICHKIGPFPWRQDKLNHACIYVDYSGKGAIEAELLANARLIAAAPELLEAAEEGLAAGKALMNIMAEMDSHDFIRAELWLEQCGVKKAFGKRIGDAIAKARDTGKEDT